MPLDRNDFKHRLAFQLKKARDEADLVQEQIAERLACTQGRISKIEGGHLNLDLFEAAEVAAAYETSLSALMHAILATPISEDDRALLERGFFGNDRGLRRT